MKSSEFMTEWKKYEKVDPLLSRARKAATLEINKITKEFGLNRKWSSWGGSEVGIQFWMRDDNVDNKTLALSPEYLKLLRKLCRQLNKSPHIANARALTDARYPSDIKVKITY